MKIMLDAGHGGSDPGAISKSGLEYEKDLTLAIVLEMESMLLVDEVTSGWDLILTRKDDTALTPGARRRLIEKESPDAFVSVHCNAATTPSANGAEVIYRDKLDEGLAYTIQHCMTTMLQVRDRGIKTDIGDLRRSLSVLSTPGVPSVIVEPGFITNEKDLALLLQTRTVAEVLVKGLKKWAGFFS